MHRFAVPDMGVPGHDPLALARRLEYLRKHRYRLLGAEELVRYVENRTPLPERAVGFTVDDGYCDFLTVGAPVFAAYDCPVTVFLITDFVAGRLWNWFDKVEWAFRESPRTDLKFAIGNESVAVGWTNHAQRLEASECVVEKLKRVRDPEKEALVARLANSLEVSYPAVVPERDRAMTWEDVRRCASLGVSFGPHTVTHPILSQVDSERARREIVDSWQTVKAESTAPAPIFCYPNGTPADFSDREESIIDVAGMKAALSTVQASVPSSKAGLKVEDRFAIPRFSYPDRDSSFIEIASGLHTLVHPR